MRDRRCRSLRIQTPLRAGLSELAQFDHELDAWVDPETLEPLHGDMVLFADHGLRVNRGYI